MYHHQWRYEYSMYYTLDMNEIRKLDLRGLNWIVYMYNIIYIYPLRIDRYILMKYYWCTQNAIFILCNIKLFIIVNIACNWNIVLFTIALCLIFDISSLLQEPIIWGAEKKHCIDPKFTKQTYCKVGRAISR